jgi:hypothetical protein
VSLTVPASLLEKAQRGAVWDDEFVDCIRESLPYAWSTVERLAKELMPLVHRLYRIWRFRPTTRRGVRLSAWSAVTRCEEQFRRT